MMRPPFLQLGGEDKYAEYKAKFDSILPSGLIDVLGNAVTFGRDRCHHICYKTEGRGRIGPRNFWRQDRAERIPFIVHALQQPDMIYINHNDWAYLVEIKQDVENNYSPELFVVITTPVNVKQKEPRGVEFRSGYQIDGKEWGDYKRNQICVYPEPVPKTLKPKQNKK